MLDTETSGEEIDMQKHENVAEVGDVIKAYDFKPFPGRPEAFIVGKVVDKIDRNHYFFKTLGYTAYVIECHYDTIAEEQTEHNRIGEKVYVPFQVSMMEYDERVKLLKRG
jgi:hypothetical protein